MADGSVRAAILGALCLLVMMSRSLVEGHGRLIDPASRSSLWRFGYKGAVTNYDDNSLYCGGFNNQKRHGGKCGICGDPFQGPRHNEAGGKYAKGIIAKTYSEGDVIEVKVEITANHKGWFEFRVCPNNNFSRPATKACLDRNLLQLADGSGTRHNIGTIRGVISTMVRLPAGVHCSQCVFQWKYHAGNNWGVDPGSGRGCVGCGPQEEFYGCADIVINPKDSNQPRPTNTTTMSSPITTSTTTTPSGSTSTTSTRLVSYPQHATTTTGTPIPPTTTITTTAGKPDQHSPKTCRSAGAWKGQAGMDEWCVNNCAAGYCPATHCECGPVNTHTTQGTVDQHNPGHAGCKAVGAWKGQAGMDAWCVRNCAAGYCPESHCKCGASKPERPSSTTTTTTTTAPTTLKPVCVSYAAIGVHAGDDIMDSYCQLYCTMGSCPLDVCACSRYSDDPSSPPGPTPSRRCKPADQYRGLPHMEQFCQVICTAGNCSSSKHCVCQDVRQTTTPEPATTNQQLTSQRVCKAYGPYERQASEENMCRNCQPGQCPHDVCICSDEWGNFPAAPPSLDVQCQAADSFNHIASMVQWCVTVCLAGDLQLCTPDRCACIAQTVDSGDAEDDGQDDGGEITTPMDQQPPGKLQTESGATQSQSRCVRYAAWGLYAGDSIMDAYCQLQCVVGSCSAQVCTCAAYANDAIDTVTGPSTVQCTPRQQYRAIPHFTDFCNALCSTGSCATNHCSCQS